MTMILANGSRLHRLCSMNTSDGHNWTGSYAVTDHDVHSIEYCYHIYMEGEISRSEWNGVPRCFPYTPRDCFFHDFWMDVPPCSYLYSAAYVHCISHALPSTPQIMFYDRTLIFRVQAPNIGQGESVGILGNLPTLGAWNPQRVIRLQRGGLHEWYVCLSAAGLHFPFEYKYVVLDDRTGDILRWEEGDNRMSPMEMKITAEVQSICDYPFRCQGCEWKAAGVVIPVFSLRTEGSQGIGDFGDLREMVGWAHHTGMQVLQLLPIYDTTQTHTWMDSYPYNAITIYALHPIYTDLRQLPVLDDKAFMKRYRRECKRLNSMHEVDYEAVMRLKTDYLRLLYDKERSCLAENDAYREFTSTNEAWLIPYSIFCLLRDEFGTSHYTDWPILSNYNEQEVWNYASTHRDELGFYSFQQYILHNQLLSATQEARDKGVILKGDIPIGISRNSVEAWMEPHYFHLNGQAGAPPDDFSDVGQNWGFPTYDWEQMAQDGYSWWRKRLAKMATYFDAYRIDHVLGFFRIWEIPMDSVHGLMGHFAPALPMSESEIEQYGIPFDETRLTTPYITDAMLRTHFGRLTKRVKSDFLDAASEDTYSLKTKFETQRQVEAYFAGRRDKTSIRLRDSLYRMISNVLFIADADCPGHYHPRVGAINDEVMTALSPAEQDSYRRLYEHYFYHRHNDFWKQQALQKLQPLLASNSMLVCAEDLGMVPDCVPGVLASLGMLSLEIQAMPKRMGLRFGRLEENPYQSVATLFTHDMPTLRQWWEEDAERTAQYCREVLHLQGAAPEVLPGNLAEEVIRQHLDSPSMLCLLSLQDWLAMDKTLRAQDADTERINIPANPRHYWRYRMRLTVEDLMQSEGFNQRIRIMIESAGR